jgi:DNA-binding PadR family transcriptional regulator
VTYQPRRSPRSRSSPEDLSNVAVEILLTLLQGERHGYAIKLDVERRIGGSFLLGSGSLYQALQRLERRGYVSEAEDREPADARRGRVYRIEPAGRRALEAEFARMSRVLRSARRRTAEAGTK